MNVCKLDTSGLKYRGDEQFSKGWSFALTTWNKGESCWSKNKEVAYLNMGVWMTCFSTLKMRCWEILNKMK